MARAAEVVLGVRGLIEHAEAGALHRRPCHVLASAGEPSASSAVFEAWAVTVGLAFALSAAFATAFAPVETD